MKNSRSSSIPGYLYPLDGLRAISLIFIYIYHSWQQSWVGWNIKLPSGKLIYSFDPIHRFGYIAIDSFFVLSGFCLFYPIARSMFGESKQISWKEFYIKRAKRILPSYFFLLLVIWFIPDLGFLNTFSGTDKIRHYFASIIFAQNCRAETYGSLISTGWTLVIEVQFYLIFPLLAYIFKKKPVLSFIGTLIFSEAIRLYAVSHLEVTSVIQGAFIFYIDIFACGMICAYFVVYARNKLPHMDKLKILMTVISVLSIYLVYRYMIWMGQTNIPNIDAVAVQRFIYRPIADILIASFIFSACFSLKFWKKWIWGNRFVIYLSTISYNFYLWHQNIHIFFKRHSVDFLYTMQDTQEHTHLPMIRYMLFTLFISLIISTLATYLIEKPFYKYGLKLFKKAIFPLLKHNR